MFIVVFFFLGKSKLRNR